MLLKGAVIELVPAKETADDRNVIHSFTRATDLAIGGLIDGVTYYVHLDTNDPTNKFQLMAKPGDLTTLMTLDATGLTATHHIGTEGIDLGAPTSVGTFALHLALLTAGSPLQQHLRGPGGSTRRPCWRRGRRHLLGKGPGGGAELSWAYQGHSQRLRTVDVYVGAPIATVNNRRTGPHIEPPATYHAPAHAQVTDTLQPPGDHPVAVAKGKVTLTNTSRATVGNGVRSRSRRLPVTADSAAPDVQVNGPGGVISHAERKHPKRSFETHALSCECVITAGGNRRAHRF